VAIEPDSDKECSIASALGIIGDRWTILILRDAFRGIRRFDDFRKDLDIARPVLSDRLRKLVDAGVMTRIAYQQRPERFEYRLTPMGIELSPALVALMRWGDTWLSTDGPPTVLVHDVCGHPLEQGFWCQTCHETFSPTEIASRPGVHAHPPAPDQAASTISPDPDIHGAPSARAT